VARCLVHPATLLARFRPDLAGGLPEPECTIGDGKPRRHVEPAPLQVEQQITPVVRALAGASGEADQFLAAFRRRADQHEDALLFVFKARLEMDAIGPDVDVALRRQIALLPRGVLVEPAVLQAADGGCREPGSILAEQRSQRLREVAGRDTLQVSDGSATDLPRVGGCARCVSAALPAPEQTDKVFAISLPVGNWIVFYSFVIDHEVPFAYERPLCARSGHSRDVSF
jgi:hypothetical protein